MRKKLGLTQAEAGVIIGGGKRAFQAKEESGRTLPSDAAVGLIEILGTAIPKRLPLCGHFRMATPKALGQETQSAGTGIFAGKRVKRGVRSAAA